MAGLGAQTWVKVGLLGSLYFAQGLPFGFFTQALPVVLREQHYDLKWVGLSSLLGLPWALKWIWAPLVDRVYWVRFGRRRSWIVPLQVISVAALGVLAWVPMDGAVWGLVVGCVLSSALAATLDVATDGLAVEILTADERPLGNAVQVGAYRVGMVVGGGLLLIVFDQAGWSSALTSMALLLTFATVPIVGYRERDAEQIVVPRLSGTGFISRAGVWPWIGVLVAYKLGDAFATSMLRPFLVDSGLSLTKIALLLGTVGSIASLAGAVLGGVFMRRWGQRRSLAVLSMFTGACLLGYALAAALPELTRDWSYWAVLVVVEHVASSMATVALFAGMMSYCRRGSEGGDYTLQASIVVVCTGAAAAGSGFSAEALGYVAHFALGALTCLLVGAALLLLQRHSQVRP